ncbi:hypothetical protein ACFYO2_13495 [Streptomyces sp. NPDC006602]|uniref:hypothetical protein n=1 Tax=Streptomyces sp. NPDC006602 TaxID=3364751 RepID=UPI0036C244FC
MVVDGVHGQEIDDVNVTLERHVNGFWETVPLLRKTGSVPAASVRHPTVGSYRLSLDTAAFYAAQGSTPPLTGSVVTFWLAAVARSCTLMVTVTGHTQFSAFCWND